MYCEKCRISLSNRESHAFAGWGFYVVYCASCCPREVDGTECEKEHPEECKDSGAEANRKAKGE